MRQHWWCGILAGFGRLRRSRADWAVTSGEGEQERSRWWLAGRGMPHRVERMLARTAGRTTARITARIGRMGLSMSRQTCGEPRYGAWMMGYPEMVGPNRVGPELSAEGNRETNLAGGLASPQRRGYWRLMRVGSLTGGISGGDNERVPAVAVQRSSTPLPARGGQQPGSFQVDCPLPLQAPPKG